MKLTSQHMKMARALSVALIATVSLGAVSYTHLRAHET